MLVDSFSYYPFFSLSSSATLKMALCFHALCSNLWSIFFSMQEEEDDISNWAKKGLNFLLPFSFSILYCILSSVSISCASASFLLCLFVLLLIPEVCGMKRKSQSFRDEDYYISSVPQNQVCLVHPVQKNYSYIVCTALEMLIQFLTYSWL